MILFGIMAMVTVYILVALFSFILSIFGIFVDSDEDLIGLLALGAVIAGIWTGVSNSSWETGIYWGILIFAGGVIIISKKDG